MPVSAYVNTIERRWRADRGAAFSGTVHSPFSVKSNLGSSLEGSGTPEETHPCTDIVDAVVSTTLQPGFAQGALQFIACA